MQQISRKTGRPIYGLRAAINAKCKECIYDPVGGKGTWRKQVENCTAKTCPLWPIRPKSEPKEK